MKIIQIAVGSEGNDQSFEAGLYGLGDDGSVYFWGRKKQSQNKDTVNEIRHTFRHRILPRTAKRVLGRNRRSSVDIHNLDFSGSLINK